MFTKNKLNYPGVVTFSVIFLTSVNLGQAAGQQDKHSQHDISKHGHHGMHNMSTKLTEAGNDAFGTLQEVLQQLIADPKTDWSRVNLEALRQHLADMRNFTLDIEVLEQTPIPNGVRAVVSPNNKRVSESLTRVFAAHPAQLEIETGWKMIAKQQGKVFNVTITTEKPEEVSKIRGLGFIGAMAWGNLISLITG